ncbi:LLM class flavin-dependent oxidoreductase, partial [Klebsiella variicola]
WSGRGRQFAAKHAELVFIAKSNPLEIRQGLEDIWRQAEARGRQAADVKSLTVLRIVTAPTAIEAQKKYDTLQSNYHLQAQ